MYEFGCKFQILAYVTENRLGISYTCTALRYIGFYSDVVECSTIDRRILGSILGRGMEIF